MTPVTTFAEAIGRTLADNGVGHAFGVVANGNVLAVTQLTSHGVRYLSARHEGGAVTMADAYFRTTGEVAVCTTGSGPGLTNTATGLTDAVKHRSGILLLCGDTPVAGPRRIDIDQAAFLSALGVPAIRLTDPATVRSDTLDALRRARTEQRPVALCLPPDLISAHVTEPVGGAALGPATAPLSGWPPERQAPPVVETVLDRLAAARRPLILGGLGAWRAGAAKALTDLGERLGALHTTSAMAAGLFNGSPWSLGVCGGFASPRAAELIGRADLVLAFGASLDRWTLADGRLLGPEATLVQVDTRTTPTADRVDLLVGGDAAEVAAALLDGAEARGLPRSGWRTEATDRLACLGWDREPYEDVGTGDRIDPRTLTLALAELLPRERTLVTDGGHFVGWPAMYWTVPDPAAYVFTGAAFQSIGLGFAGAVGAAVGRGDRITVVALGDGGALMGLPELETLVRAGRSALVVIYDDGGYGMEVVLYGELGADRDTMVFGDTDFAATARALGARTATVRSVADLTAVRDWRAEGAEGVLVLDCKVVPEVVADCLAGLTSVISGRKPSTP
ncbi:acetolactate synthase I/II/III large subunit [Streptomyces tendae]|uniref:thiamine pyrophosphate-binding protein n=1 Tax=Streptomyces tendae TaxID=1932 RepID=UPI00199B22F5|nr:thiamine pyrophosphate-binding protein [Streptomyces tendae]GHB11134.1 acetolactate synthase I/II/III large subunit [Streptomyces tendae]